MFSFPACVYCCFNRFYGSPNTGAPVHHSAAHTARGAHCHCRSEPPLSAHYKVRKTCCCLEKRLNQHRGALGLFRCHVCVFFCYFQKSPAGVEHATDTHTHTHRRIPQTSYPDQTVRQPAGLPGSLPPHRRSVLTSGAGGQKLRAVWRISSKTHSSAGKSVRGPPLDTGSKCATTGGRWKKQPELEGGDRVSFQSRTVAAAGLRGQGATATRPRLVESSR